jgi:hypothetical protein
MLQLFVDLGFEMVKKVLKKCNLNGKQIVQGVKPLLTKIIVKYDFFLMKL